MPRARLAIVADIHHGIDTGTKRGPAAMGLLAEFARFVADARPDAVIELGDRISDVDHDADLRLEADVAAAFRPIAAPVYHLCGNPDRDFISVEENERILGQSLAHGSVDIGDWRIVLWRADTRIRRPRRDGQEGMIASESDLAWLGDVVRAADRPLAIMSHVPVSGHSQIGNFYFQRVPGAATYNNAAEARAILHRAKVPVVWLAGHVHWNTLTTVDGIPHLTMQSLTESFTTTPDPSGAWAMLELDDAINFRVYGKDPFAITLDPAASTRRWLTPRA